MPSNPNIDAVDNTFLQQLVNSEIISKKIVGIAINQDLTKTSRIRFGDIDQSFIKSGYELDWLDTSSKASWYLPLSDAIYAKESIYNQTTTSAIINPSYFAIRLPPADFEAFFDIWSLKKDASKVLCPTKGTCLYDGKCSYLSDSDFKLRLGAGDQASYYSIQASTFQYEINEQCHLGIVGEYDNAMDSYILGNLFLQNFYVAFDQDNMRVGITVQEGQSAYVSKTAAFPAWEIAVIVIAIVGLTAIVGVVTACILKKRHSRYAFVKGSSLIDQDDKAKKTTPAKVYAKDSDVFSPNRNTTVITDISFDE